MNTSNYPGPPESVCEPVDALFLNNGLEKFCAFKLISSLNKWLFLFLLILINSISLPYASCQNVDLVLDSLLNKIRTFSSDTIKVDNLNEFAYQSRNDEELSEQSANLALQLAQKIDYKKGMGDSYVRLGIIAKNRGQVEIADSNYHKALAIRQDLGEPGPVISVYNNLGILHRNDRNYEKALGHYLSGLKLAEAKENKMKARLLNGLATCYNHLANYTKALKYNQLDLDLRRELQDDKWIAVSLLTAGNIYQKLRNFSTAETRYKKSLEILEALGESSELASCYINLATLYYEQGKYEKSIEYSQQAHKLESYLTVDQQGIMYRNLGAYYDIIRQPDSALYFYNRSREVYDLNNKYEGLADIYYSLGLLHSKIENPRKALEYFTRCQELIEQHGISDLLLKMNLFKELAAIHVQKAAYELALQYENRGSLIRDSLNRLAMEAANYKSNFEEERRLNQHLADQVKIQTLKNMQLIYILIAAIILIASAAGFTLMIFRQRQRRRETKREIDDLLKEQEIATNYARIEGQDEERQRIAQDLHDGLGGMLSTVKLYFSALDSKMDLMRMESQEQFNKANQLLDEAFKEVRKVAHEMHAGILKNFGLKIQLEDLAEKINTSKQIKVELVTHKFNDRLETKLEVNIYRIVQELISNALKHAKASTLSIQLNRFGDIVNIIVEDNGIGFKEDASVNKGGIGLSGVQARVKALKGTMDIDSVLGRGTTISIDIPYQPITILSEKH